MATIINSLASGQIAVLASAVAATDAQVKAAKDIALNNYGTNSHLHEAEILNALAINYAASLRLATHVQPAKRP